MTWEGQRGRLELFERVARTPEAASWWSWEETKGLRVNTDTKREHGLTESGWKGLRSGLHSETTHRISLKVWARGTGTGI